MSPSNLDSTLCFIQPGISQAVLCISVKLAGWPYTVLSNSFPSLEPVCCSMSSSKYCPLTHTQIYQETGKVIWYPHLFQNVPQFLVIHTVKGFDLVNEAEIDVFSVLSCFFYDPVEVGNLISGSFPFSTSRLYTWNFSVHIKPSLKDFEHNLASM